MVHIVELFNYHDGDEQDEKRQRTSIVVHDREISFDRSNGVTVSQEVGNPDERQKIGTTTLALKQIEEMLFLWARDRFATGAYNEQTNNCISFSNQLAHFLCGKTIINSFMSLPPELQKDLIVKSGTVSSSSLPSFGHIVKDIGGAIASMFSSKK